jgi:hypothetical protein
MMKRRGFLGGLAAAVVAKPKVDAKAVEAAMGITDAAPIFPPSGLGGIGGRNVAGVSEKWALNELTQYRALKALMPDWWVDERRDDSKHVGTFDPDLACMVSMSPAVKRAIQQDRNFKRRMEYEENYLVRRVAREAFKI